jgi:hypothetical protein
VILDLGCIVPARNERLEERMEQEKSSSSRASEDWIACSRADMVELATTLPAIEGSEPGDVGMEAAWLRSVIWPVDDEELQLRNLKVPELDNESAQFPSELPLERDSLPPLKKIAFWSSCCLASNSSALTKSDRLLGPRNKQSASTRWGSPSPELKTCLLLRLSSSSWTAVDLPASSLANLTLNGALMPGRTPHPEASPSTYTQDKATGQRWFRLDNPKVDLARLRAALQGVEEGYAHGQLPQA